jgi:hypothetical protein
LSHSPRVHSSKTTVFAPGGIAAEAISGIALELLNALTAVQGQEHYAIMIGWLLNLSLQHDLSPAGGSARVMVRGITATLAGAAAEPVERTMTP